MSINYDNIIIALRLAGLFRVRKVQNTLGISSRTHIVLRPKIFVSELTRERESNSTLTSLWFTIKEVKNFKTNLYL